jgi:hypothetical protein
MDEGPNIWGKSLRRVPFLSVVDHELKIQSLG